MMMHRLGYRYVVRRPVHPEALRNVLRRALHDDQGAGQDAVENGLARVAEGAVSEIVTPGDPPELREHVVADDPVHSRSDDG